MLCNELFDLMKEEREGFEGIAADCVDFDIHKWRVRVSDIEPTSNLMQGLSALKERYGYAHLELELSFTPDMHPFYPVFVKVRPCMASCHDQRAGGVAWVVCARRYDALDGGGCPGEPGCFGAPRNHVVMHAQ